MVLKLDTPQAPSFQNLHNAQLQLKQYVEKRKIN